MDDKEYEKQKNFGVKEIEFIEIFMEFSKYLQEISEDGEISEDMSMALFRNLKALSGHIAESLSTRLRIINKKMTGDA